MALIMRSFFLVGAGYAFVQSYKHIEDEDGVFFVLLLCWNFGCVFVIRVDVGVFSKRNNNGFVDRCLTSFRLFSMISFYLICFY